MAVSVDETERNPLSSNVGHVPGAELISEESQTPKGSIGTYRSLDGADLIIEEHDSLLHADKLSVPISNVRKHVPWFAWALLAASLVAVASAAVVFASIKDVPTFALAAWRLQLTTVLLSPAAVFQYSKLSPGDNTKFFRSIPLILASGASLGVHFAFWVWSVHHTSLSHALLFSSASPLLIAVGILVLRKPISAGEISGTLLGVVGAVLLTRANNVDQQVTLAGDFSGFMTAVFFVGYILIGGHLRQWLPIFLYAVPVTGFAALLLSVSAVLSGQVTLTGKGNTGLFGWFSMAYLPKVVYLAVVPGIVGHTGFNAVLKWIPALMVTLALTSEPPIGTVMGWAVGLADVPGVWTFSGGFVLLVSTAIVIVAGDRRKKAELAAAESSSDKPDRDTAARDVELAEKN